MTLQRQSYTSGHFELAIDGHKSTAYVKSVDGGDIKANAIDEAVGPHNQRMKHVSTLEIEPFTIDMSIAGADDMLKWIQASFNKQASRRNGQITHANFNLQRTFEHEFYDALISEVTFPALDGASKDAAYLKVKMQPERVVQRKIPPGPKLETRTGSKHKLWLANGFRLTIDRWDDLKHTNKIEAFTVKQGIKKHYMGGDRYPELEPTKIEFPHIVGSIALDYADSLMAWHRRYIVDGERDTSAGHLTGSLEYLDPSKTKTLFQINLFEVGIHRLQLQQSQANQDSIKRVKFELYVGRMELDGGGLGME